MGLWHRVVEDVPFILCHFVVWIFSVFEFILQLMCKLKISVFDVWNLGI